MTQTIVNGVDVAKLGETIEAIKADPAIATFQFRVANAWVDGGLNRSHVEGFFGAKEEMRHETAFDFDNDEPAILLSGDKAPNPVEYVLHALAGCLTTTLVYHAAARGIAVRGVSTRFEGDLDLRGFLGLRNDVRRGFSTIRVAFEIDADLDDAGKRDLIDMAQMYSPVFDIVTRGVPVQARLADTAARKAA